MIQRKKKGIDSVDRDILRLMSKVRRPLTGNQISQRVNLSGAALIPRLSNLKSKGIIKPVKIAGMRTFIRKFRTKKGIISKKIKAPRSINWGLDLKKSKKKTSR